MAFRSNSSPHPTNQANAIIFGAQEVLKWTLCHKGCTSSKYLGMKMCHSHRWHFENEEWGTIIGLHKTYLSTVRQSKFIVDERYVPHAKKLEPQSLHSRFPSHVLPKTLLRRFRIWENKTRTTEEAKSIALCKNKGMFWVRTDKSQILFISILLKIFNLPG